ncbi:ABC transporter permease [Streptomyces zagrosensis]|uniref:NitT/TauT family transport system permease protein n=1 Tax=Streptomyces zagrosensis TaxID=1042984 RepID=A0A7W9Q9I1_9ACTN|nr:ABC transporter permease [Streptomyces zagrosensis]MBB5936110.1 NitT/TauT family transport system permease protein [Streptomyces zagrosensis]
MASTDTRSPGDPEPQHAASASPIDAGNTVNTVNAGRPGGAGGKGSAAGASDQLAGLEAGLDALETHTKTRVPLGRVLLDQVLPPVVAVALVLIAWQLAYHFEVKPHYQLPSPAEVARALQDKWLDGTLLGYVWESLSRGALGFAASLIIGTPLGLVVARVWFVRAAIGPILSGLQSLPSVAWVPAAIIWFGLTNSTIYAVVLLGAVPSIANGLVAGVDQIPPLFLRAGRTIGATGFAGIRHVLLPAALPGYIAGLKQGWAFSWRSLMAAELIATSPELGTGLGQLLDQARVDSDMSLVLAAILLILIVGIGIELLIFAPIERRVLRSRGLLASNR